jgi:hypothetical protein
MYSDILRSIVGIEVFPIVSLLLFVAVFVVMLVKVGRADRVELERLAAIPLDRDGMADAANRIGGVQGDVR